MYINSMTHIFRSIKLLTISRFFENAFKFLAFYAQSNLHCAWNVLKEFKKVNWTELISEYFIIIIYDFHF